MNARIELTQDEIAEKIDELSALCATWEADRKIGRNPRFRAAIVMTCQDVAALVRVQEVGNG